MGKSQRQDLRGSISVWTLGNSLGSGLAFWSGAAASQPVQAAIIAGPAQLLGLVWGWHHLGVALARGDPAGAFLSDPSVHPARPVLLTGCSGQHPEGFSGACSNSNNKN